jgi:hypothetical protein
MVAAHVTTRVVLAVTRSSVRGLAIKFPDWCEKEMQNTRKSKIILFLFIVVSAYLSAYVESFKKFLKTVSKGHHIFLNVFSILKPVSFEGSLHLRKEKVQ